MYREIKRKFDPGKHIIFWLLTNGIVTSNLCLCLRIEVIII